MGTLSSVLVDLQRNLISISNFEYHNFSYSHLLAIFNPQEGRVALNVELIANRTMLGAIDFTDAHGIVVLQAVGQLTPCAS